MRKFGSLPQHRAASAANRRSLLQRNLRASAAALLKVVDAEKPPLRVLFGELPLQLARADYAERLKIWEEWQPVAVEADG